MYSAVILILLNFLVLVKDGIKDLDDIELRHGSQSESQSAAPDSVVSGMSIESSSGVYVESEGEKKSWRLPTISPTILFSNASTKEEKKKEPSSSAGTPVGLE
jgi:hypothetical protein